MKQDMIVILDLGSTENTVLARAIRALGVYSEIYPHDITAAELTALPNVKGVIINGGPNHVIDGVDIDVPETIFLSSSRYLRFFLPIMPMPVVSVAMLGGKCGIRVI